MSAATSPQPRVRFSPLTNWIGLTGVVVTVASLFAFVLLFTLALFSKQEGAYLGVLTYLIAPGFCFLGILLTLVGWIAHRRSAAKHAGENVLPILTIDLSRPKDRRFLTVFLSASAVFILVTAIVSYQAYHVTKSVVFCGQACHTAMEPEYVTYQHTAHAQVECTHCHIAPGADNFLKAKLGGLHQVYATVFNKVPRPVLGYGKTQVSQQTCERCHWPDRYVGYVNRIYHHFLDGEENTPYTVALALNVGGGDPTHGPVGGIHWHMNVANKVEYIATDEKLQSIPWVRFTNKDGVVTEYRTEDFEDDPADHKIHVMDCVDCHNRPAHNFRSPNDAVDLAMFLGTISTNLPTVRRTAVLALAQDYGTKAEAMEGIAERLREAYGDHPDLPGAIQAVQSIYQLNFFPAMKADYSVYPNNIGHKDWPGCFRCHDGLHTSADGEKAIGASDCNSCHLILAQGKGEELVQIHPAGMKFAHPEEGWEDLQCFDCHNGSMEE